VSTPSPQRHVSSYRFLLSRRWLGLLLVVIVVTIACYELGRWQFHRYDERHQHNVVTRENLRSDPVRVDEVMSTTAAPDDDDEWRRVKATGTYDVEHQIVVLYRTRNSAPGVDVVTPLVTSSGDGLLVDRGWVQTKGNGNEPADVPHPPGGTVDVTGWVRINADAGSNRTTLSEGSVRSISSDALQSSVPYDLFDGFLDLTDESPKASPSPERADPPDLSGGPSFFYGIQWWFFGLLAVGFWVYFAYAERVHPRDEPARTAVQQQPESSEPVAPEFTDRG
jgi:cytochrome oxidase assembly protein ShyY1